MAGRFQDQGVYLGFRRLAILDLTAEGNQPMTSGDGRYTLVFNGEIYNFLELRAELEGEGEVFRSHSDTEVLLRLYAKLGLRCLEKLNGMFAFGLYDRLEQTLLLVRDRLGVKPLFYWQQGRTFAFASEVCRFAGCRGFPRNSTGRHLDCTSDWGRFLTGVQFTVACANCRPVAGCVIVWRGGGRWAGQLLGFAAGCGGGGQDRRRMGGRNRSLALGRNPHPTAIRCAAGRVSFRGH